MVPPMDTLNAVFRIWVTGEVNLKRLLLVSKTPFFPKVSHLLAMFGNELLWVSTHKIDVMTHLSL
jgi:hypothetical protein